jgi:serine O-acetyltransferase
MLAALRADVRAARERDPAARSTAELVLCYPGLHAVWGHRASNWLWRHGRTLLARLCSAFTRFATGVDIHPAAVLGPGLFIDHATGVVIGETAVVGRDVTIYHGVTLGGTSLDRGKRHPTVGDRVTIGAGAKVLGPITIGHDSRIGANAVVVKPVPPDSVVVGVPGHVIMRKHARAATAPADLDNAVLPDLVGVSLRALHDRIEELESRIDGGGPPGPASPLPVSSDSVGSHLANAGPAGARPASAQPADREVWYEQDFSI